MMNRVLTLLFLVGSVAIGFGQDAPIAESSAPAGTAFREESLPFSIDASRSRAHKAGNALNVYLVGQDDVLVLIIALPEKKMETISRDISSSSGGSIRHFHGHGIAPYVLPAGPAMPIPPDLKYTERRASGGTITCRNAPVKGGFASGEKIVVSAQHVELGDGKVYVIDPIELITSPFPP